VLLALLRAVVPELLLILLTLLLLLDMAAVAVAVLEVLEEVAALMWATAVVMVVVEGLPMPTQDAIHLALVQAAVLEVMQAVAGPGQLLLVRQVFPVLVVAAVAVAAVHQDTVQVALVIALLAEAAALVYWAKVLVAQAELRPPVQHIFIQVLYRVKEVLEVAMLKPILTILRVMVALTAAVLAILEEVVLAEVEQFVLFGPEILVHSPQQM
jgi:hypothetical protein